jgi:hypothetical protein
VVVQREISLHARQNEGDLSLTTRYRDYAVALELILWQSQSVTRADRPAGLRYQDHTVTGRSILRFASTRTDNQAFWFLGSATYIEHEGEQPMAVTWKLHSPLPDSLFAAFA